METINLQKNNNDIFKMGICASVFTADNLVEMNPGIYGALG